MPDQIRDLLLVAVTAARHGTQPELCITQAVKGGDRKMRIDQLNFDSLAWMEFCICIELESGQELTPNHISEMQYVCEIEDWLRART
jgi:hypothetical protein